MREPPDSVAVTSVAQHRRVSSGVWPHIPIERIAMSLLALYVALKLRSNTPQAFLSNAQRLVVVLSTLLTATSNQQCMRTPSKLLLRSVA